MNLLLLLSALLSALTGVGGARLTAAPQAVCAQQAEVRPVRTAAATGIARPAQALPHVAALLASQGMTFVLRPATPIFASRRRE